ncbi:hypothetical protein [Kangiella sediminilitoris]|uniref:Lipoprotein n=1 Tax=Kangiella sediminilitoris TaxID=1144748 RepID=A0A1B3BAQ6_9GAMM|nr:hypothetical protein [Kangiella sediminilitoris]AOE49882.1 hypothetical protein KS2013_1162 [Kangiella sediminilitoris]
MMKTITGAVCAMSLIVGAGVGLNTAKADEVKVPVAQQGQEKNIQVPKAGVTKSYVEQNFGSPNRVEGPVGEPPITKWIYNDYTVYFEYDRVIHSVIHKG